jgi:hypothetical protein
MSFFVRIKSAFGFGKYFKIDHYGKPIYFNLSGSWKIRSESSYGSLRVKRMYVGTTIGEFVNTEHIWEIKKMGRGGIVDSEGRKFSTHCNKLLNDLSNKMQIVKLTGRYASRLDYGSAIIIEIIINHKKEWVQPYNLEDYEKCTI